VLTNGSGILDKHPAQKDTKHVIIRGSTNDTRAEWAYTPWVRIAKKNWKKEQN
jgi:hypothetical protein